MQSYTFSHVIKHIRAVVILFILFAVAVYPNLGRPLSKHHEFNAGMVLICVDTWNTEGGPSWSGYTPVLNYSNKGDLFIDYQSSLIRDHKGNNIYASFGSGWFLLPYYFFQLFHLPATPLSLQIFTLFLAFIAMLFIYRIALLLFSSYEAPEALSCMVTALFIFNPAVLWYFSNGYFHEVGAWPFFLAVVFFTLRWRLYNRISLSAFILTILCTIISIFCDWLMVLWIAVMTLFFLPAILKLKQELKIILVLGIAGIMAIVFIMMIYAHHFGMDEYLSSLLERTRYRTLNNTNASLAGGMIKALGANYVTALLPLLALVSTLFVFSAIKKWNVSWHLYKPLLPLAITVLLHQIIFLQFSSQHEYSVLKAAAPVALLAGILLANLKRKVAIVFVALTCTAGVTQYYVINRPGPVSYKGDFYHAAKAAGDEIRKTAEPDEFVFGPEYNMRPQIQYYAKRNLISAATPEEAIKQLLHHTPGKKGIWFDIRKDGTVAGFQRFTVTR